MEVERQDEELIKACKDGNKDLALLAIKKGAVWLNEGLATACRNGNGEIASLIIEYGLRAGREINMNKGLAYACLGGHRDVAELMIKYGANDWNWGLTASGYHKECGLLMLEKGATSGCHFELLDMDIYYLVQKGVKYFRNYQPYQTMADDFKTSRTQLLVILNNILNKDLISEILLF